MLGALLAPKHCHRLNLRSAQWRSVQHRFGHGVDTRLDAFA